MHPTAASQPGPTPPRRTARLPRAARATTSAGPAGGVLGPETGELRSAIYEGTVVHRRTGGGSLGPAHDFSYRLAMVLVDLDEIEDVCARHPLWRSGAGPAAVRLGRRELPGDPAIDPAEAARQAVAAQLGVRPSGPVAVLTQPRTWGWQFNPVTFAFCHAGPGRPGTGLGGARGAAEGARPGDVAALALEVTNTPWHERVTYAVGPPGEHLVGKEMHVSPFLPMDLRYRIRYGAPEDRLRISIDVERDGDPDAVVLRTVLSLGRRPMTRESMSRLLWRYPAMATRVSTGIYAQAARLRLAGAPFHPHPDAGGRRPGRHGLRWPHAGDDRP